MGNLGTLRLRGRTRTPGPERVERHWGGLFVCFVCREIIKAQLRHRLPKERGLVGS